MCDLKVQYWVGNPLTLLKIKGIMTALAKLKVSYYAFMQNHEEYVPVAMPGAEKLLFPEVKLFSKGNKYYQRSFFKLGMMFSAYNKIHFLAVSLPDQPLYVLLGSVAHYFYGFSQLPHNDYKRKETWWVGFWIPRIWKDM